MGVGVGGGGGHTLAASVRRHLGPQPMDGGVAVVVDAASESGFEGEDAAEGDALAAHHVRRRVPQRAR